MYTGTIYKLVCSDLNAKEVYVGSTENMKERKRHHRHRCHNPNEKQFHSKVYQYIRGNGGWQNWSMVEVEHLKFNRKPELKARERFHMEALCATLNCQVPGRTKAEYLHDTVEHIKERGIKYRQEHSGEIKQFQQQKHNCECGGKYTPCSKLKHMRTTKHVKFMALTEEQVQAMVA